MSQISEAARTARQARAKDAEQALWARSLNDGAEVPDDTPFLAEVTCLDPQIGQTRRQGYVWPASRVSERRADLVTWLLPEAVIPGEKLEKVEAYDAQLSMTLVLFDEMHVIRTGTCMDLSESAAKLRRLRKKAGQKST